MGRRGPRAEKIVAVGDAELKLACPEHLTAAAAAVWRQYVPAIIESGILLRVDGPILESFCTYRSLWLGYLQALESQAIGSMEYSRVAQLANGAHVQLLKTVAELGLSPNARARLKLDSAEAVQNDLEEFITKKRS